MNLSWIGAEWGSAYGVKAVPDNTLDGVPDMDSLLMDGHVSNLSEEKKLVAGVLAFGSYISGSVSTGRPVQRLAANEVSRFFKDREVTVPEVTDTPVATWPSGGGRLYITYGDYQSSEFNQVLGQPHRFVVRLYDSSQYSGAISSAHELRLTSNAQVMNRYQPERFSLDLLAVALGLVLSEDLHVRSLCYVGAESSVDWQSVRELVRATGVTLDNPIVL